MCRRVMPVHFFIPVSGILCRSHFHGQWFSVWSILSYQGEAKAPKHEEKVQYKKKQNFRGFFVFEILLSDLAIQYFVLSCLSVYKTFCFSWEWVYHPHKNKPDLIIGGCYHPGCKTLGTVYCILSVYYLLITDVPSPCEQQRACPKHWLSVQSK